MIVIPPFTVDVRVIEKILEDIRDALTATLSDVDRDIDLETQGRNHLVWQMGEAVGGVWEDGTEGKFPENEGHYADQKWEAVGHNIPMHYTENLYDNVQDAIYDSTFKMGWSSFGMVPEKIVYIWEWDAFNGEYDNYADVWQESEDRSLVFTNEFCANIGQQMANAIAPQIARMVA